MEHVKLVIGGKRPESDPKYVFGGDAKLVDLDTGKDIGCVRDITLKMPMEDAMLVEVTMVVAEVEVVQARPSPKQIHELGVPSEAVDEKPAEAEPSEV